MLGNLDPSKIQNMMKQMGMETESIDAVEVTIETKEGKLLVKDPSVMKVDMKGQEMLQVQGDLVEASKKSQEKEGESEFDEEDVKTVMEQADVSKDKAKEALEEEGDLAMAVMKLKE